MPDKRTNLPPNPITMKKPGSSNKIRGGARSIIDPDGEPRTRQELLARIAKLRAAVRHLESAPVGSRWERIEDQRALDAGGTAMDVEQSSNVEKVGVEPSVNVMDVEPPNHVEMDGVESPAHAIGEQIPKEVDAEVPTRLRSENPGGSSANINSGRTGAEPKERESIGVRKLEDDLGKGFEPSRGNKVSIRDGFTLGLTHSSRSLPVVLCHRWTKILWSPERAVANSLPRPPAPLGNSVSGRESASRSIRTQRL